MKTSRLLFLAVFSLLASSVIALGVTQAPQVNRYQIVSDASEDIEELKAALEEALEAIDTSEPMGKDVLEKVPAVKAEANAALAGNDSQAVSAALKKVNNLNARIAESVTLFAKMNEAGEKLDEAVVISDAEEIVIQEAENLIMLISEAYTTDSPLTNAEAKALTQDALAMITKLAIPADAEYANDDNPVDMTSTIMNPWYDEDGEGWSGTKAVYSSSAGNVAIANQTFDYYQEISGLPAGYYLLVVQGFYRAGTAQEDYNAWKTNPNLQNNAIVYAVSKPASGEAVSFSSPLTRLIAEASEQEEVGSPGSGFVYAKNPTTGREDGLIVANTQVAAGQEFEEEGKYYENMVIVELTEGATLRIGIKKTAAVANDWTVFDNWMMFYFGTESELQPDYDLTNRNIDILIAEADSLKDLRMWSDLREQLIQCADTYRDVTDDEQITAGMRALNDIIAEVKATISRYNEMEIMLDALAEMLADDEKTDPQLLAEATAFYRETVAAFENEELDATDIFLTTSDIESYLARLTKLYLTINVQTPGTLKSLIEAEAEELSSVVGLTVTGSINSTDLTNAVSLLRNSLEKLDLKETTLTEIPTSGFSQMKALQQIVLPKSLTTIGNSAFNGCTALEELVIPETVKTVGSSAFSNCTQLTHITCLNETPPSPRGVLMGGLESNCTLTVSLTAVDAYKNNTYWNRFNIEGDILPGGLTIARDFSLNTNDDVLQGKRPNVSIVMRDQGTSYGISTRYQYGLLNLSGTSTFSAKDFTMIYDPYVQLQQQNSSYTTKRASAVLINNASMRADNVTLQLNVPTNKWNFVYLPFDVKVSSIVNDNDVPFVIYKYDGKKRAAADMANTWVRMTADSTLHAGEGYIWQVSGYVKSNSTTQASYTFTVKAQNTTNKNNIFASGNVDVRMREYPSESDRNRSWNLVGNPYPCYFDSRAMDITIPFTVWSVKNQNYEAYSPIDDKYIFMPGEAFFIQRPIDQAAISFIKEGRQADRAARDIVYFSNARQSDMTSKRSVFNLTLWGNGQTDHTRFVINEDASIDYEMDKDASKFVSLESSALQLYTIEQGQHYAINERPIATGEVVLGLSIAQKGMYTLRLESGTNGRLILTDRQKGVERLLTDDGYTFEAEAGTQENRFVVRLATDELTGIKDMQPATTDAERPAYDLQGRRMNANAKKGLYIDNGKKVVVK